MLVLAVDTATPAVTAGVVRLDDGPPRTLARQVTVHPRAHGELLIPHVQQALAQAGAELSDVDAIVCGNGPGPFTGLRVGMVTAAALGDALGRPVYPVSTLDAIAAQARRGAPLLIVTDARRQEVYWAAYDEAGRRTEGPGVARPAELARRLGVLGVEHAAGHGAEMYAEVLGLPVEPPRYPSPEGLVSAAGAQLRANAVPAPLTPLYLRRPDAAQPGARKQVSQP
jgi:tRNA threonylcarbamoyl adenosine modification protein YeaZ